MSLQYYHDLASDDDEIRFRAAYGLLSDLAAENNPSGESLQYAVKRLIRGLASGRGSSRIGFSISLTEV
jgi:DNA polymerase phi